jgi:geranylgeranyl diphosphate synthase type II
MRQAQQSSADGGAERPTAFDLNRYMKERAALVEEALAQNVPAVSGPASPLIEAMRYSLLAGGKRLRPMLALAAGEAVGGDREAVLGFACAIEMIHTYSLVHDDLPCMDDDDLRRGRPTNHKVYGEAVATLAGDGLLTDAFRVLASAMMQAHLPAGVAMAVVAELAEAAGSLGMVGGQVIDLLGEGQDLSLEELEYLHSRKTGALIEAAVCCAARLAGATETQLAALRQYAQALGLAFQVTDDLLDVEASAEDVGKRTHKDAVRGKATYPLLLGVGPSRDLARQLADRACQALQGFDEKAAPLRALASFAVERTV